MSDFPRLLADIGGTNARFALEYAPRCFDDIQVLPTADYATFVAAVEAYLARVSVNHLKHAAIAIANPILGDEVCMTNHHWSFSIEHTRQTLGLETLLFLNDFTAQALAIVETPADELVQVGGGVSVDDAPKAVIGPGTGLGVSGLIPTQNGYVALAGEGGHVSFAPFDDTEVMIWQYAQKKWGQHVSAERLVSGAGLSLIYEALAQHHHHEPAYLLPEQVSESAINGTSTLAQRSLAIFCAMLGTVAANLTLTLGARGGVYVCGGVIPRFLNEFVCSPFRERFENKGRFSQYLHNIPVYVVLSPYAGISGAAVALNQHLSTKIRAF